MNGPTSALAARWNSRDSLASSSMLRRFHFAIGIQLFLDALRNWSDSSKAKCDINRSSGQGQRILILGWESWRLIGL